MLISGFEDLKKGALHEGALGCSISGSDPSVFAICTDQKSVSAVANVFEKVYPMLKMDLQIYISKINDQGAQIRSSVSR